MPADRVAELEQRRGQLVQRRGVALELDLELELAARDHDGHAVVAERAGDEHPVAGPDAVGRESHAVGDQRRPRRS